MIVRDTYVERDKVDAPEVGKTVSFVIEGEPEARERTGVIQRVGWDRRGVLCYEVLSSWAVFTVYRKEVTAGL